MSTCRRPSFIAASLLLCTSLAAQAPAPQAFEVAAIKPNNSGQPGGSFGFRPGGLFEVRNSTLRSMVRNAYQLQSFQIVGGPEWFDRDRFDVLAKTSDPNATPLQILVMVQTLMAERFKLIVHREQREVPTYALVVVRADGRLGSRLTRSAIDCQAIVSQPPPRPDSARPVVNCGTNNGFGRLSAKGVRLSDLARNLSNVAGRLTIDKTGLSEPFDIELQWTPTQSPAGTPGVTTPVADGPDLFTALEEQLGLTLESRREPADVFVVDSASRPEPD